MLWLGLLSRDTGIPASQHLNIKDEVVALNFNLAVTLRLLRYDNEKDVTNKRWWAKFIGGSESDEGDVLDSEIVGDKYADANTEQW